MPLDNNSRITCLTCHESAKSSGEPDQIDAGSERLLQSPENTQLCARCHTNMSGTLREQSHWQFSGQAHLDSGGIQQDGLEGRLVADIDRESRTCLSCHDEVSVAIPAYDGGGRGRPNRRNMTDHPIGVDYRRTAWRQSGQFKFLPENTSRIRLPNGQVGCGSCHSPYAKTKSQLVEPFERGILCRMCHNR